jgi:hypothetical protein
MFGAMEINESVLTFDVSNEIRLFNISARFRVNVEAEVVSNLFTSFDSVFIFIVLLFLNLLGFPLTLISRFGIF